MAKLPCAPPTAVGKDRAPRLLFNGHSVLRRTRVTSVAAEVGQQRSPLQKVNVGTLSLEQARGRLNSKAPKRFDAVWCKVLRLPEPHSSKCEPKLGTDEADAGPMGRAGVSREASQ
ncbi:hypothetical protein ERJ75_000782900 [Trypanosoma vivax]|nr:hypothetical protein ERJ75_000782900 [Trypanosoma vivax]